MRSAWLLVLGLFSVGLMDCMPMRGAGSAGEQAEPTDQELAQHYGNEVATQVADLRRKRSAALAAPTSLPAADAYAEALIAGLKANFSQINGIDWNKYMKDASDLLGTATQGQSGEPAANALVKRAALQATLGDEAGAVTTLKSAFAQGHTYATGVGMVQVYDYEKNTAEALAMCEKTRPLAKDESQIYELVGTCLAAAPPKESAQATLPWVSAEDWAVYQRLESEERERRLARRQAEQQRDAERRQMQDAPAATNGGGESAPATQAAGPERVSFTLRSSCSKTVKVFFGETPKYGSGTTTPIGGNSVQNQSMEAGKMLWIVDDSGNGLASTSVSAGTREIEITSSCTSFSSR